jgi:hypothetical protein
MERIGHAANKDPRWLLPAEWQRQVALDQFDFASPPWSRFGALYETVERLTWIGETRGLSLSVASGAAI